jgi:predicted metal-dependent phosphoesterase TrpH
MADIPEILAYVEESTDLTVLAITEHDDLAPALAAREAWANGRHRFDVITGMEITTIEGHLIGLYLEAPVPCLQRLAPTLEAVHRQGGVCVIPHPMSWLTRSIGRRTMDRVAELAADDVYFDAIEVASSPAARFSFDKAERLNRERYHLAEVGGSDAHFLPSIGSSYTEFGGSTADDLRRGIETHTTRAIRGSFPSMRTLGYRQVARQQWRGFMATPRAMGWLPTIGSFLKRAKPS